jgi:hypothetical protein
MAPQKEKTSNNSQINQTENKSYPPIYIEKLTPAEKRIYKYLFWFEDNCEKVFLSIPKIAKECKCCKRTVQRFEEKWKNILINITYNNRKTNHWSIPDNIFNFIKKYGGGKIIDHLERYKDKIFEKVFQDTEKEELIKSSEQVMNKIHPKMSPIPDEKCHPNSSFVFNSLFNEEVLLRFGLNDQEILKLNKKFGSDHINQAIDDAIWYSKKEKIKYPFCFINKQAQKHIQEDFLNKEENMEVVINITPEEKEKLIQKIGKDKTDYYIEALELHLISIGKPKKYKSHYATILSWNLKDERKNKNFKDESVKEQNIRWLQSKIKSLESINARGNLKYNSEEAFDTVLNKKISLYSKYLPDQVSSWDKERRFRY